LTGIRRRGHNQPIAGKSSPEFADQLTDGQDFPHGYGMDPDRRAFVAAKPFGNTAQPFAQPGAILTVSQRLKYPVWQAEKKS
jgi:hypothetical protein